MPELRNRALITHYKIVRTDKYRLAAAKIAGLLAGLLARLCDACERSIRAYSVSF